MINRTKIIATISSKRCDSVFLQTLIDEGIDVIRINSAHCSPVEADTIIQNLRRVSDKIPVIIDTKGPEIRICPFITPFDVKTGEEIRFYAGVNSPEGQGNVSVTYSGFVDELHPGLQILVDDGDLAFEIVEKGSNYLLTKVLNSGKLQPKKSVNVPGVTMKLPALSERDREFVRFAIENHVEFIAHSFVRNASDLQEIQSILDAEGSRVKLIAKIENQEGVDNIDEILDHSFGIMVARGDLGIEIEAEKIPLIQRKLNKKAIEKQKPVIIATQMLHSMINNPRPTRAEVTDIAHAVMEGADALMLSGETAMGDYPVEAVRIMDKIISEVEQNMGEKMIKSPKIQEPLIGEILGRSAVWSSHLIKAKAIVCDTITGRTIRHLSAQRGRIPVLAMCYNREIMRELAILYGVFSFYIPLRNSTDNFILESMNALIESGRYNQDDLVVVLGGNFGPTKGATFLEIGTIENLLHREN
jgi:pyruvate kinase